MRHKHEHPTRSRSGRVHFYNLIWLYRRLATNGRQNPKDSGVRLNRKSAKVVASTSGKHPTLARFSENVNKFYMSSAIYP
jgi:hypothetical protein